MKKMILLFLLSSILMFSCLFFIENQSLMQSIFISVGASFLTFVIPFLMRKEKRKMENQSEITFKKTNSNNQNRVS